MRSYGTQTQSETAFTDDTEYIILITHFKINPCNLNFDLE